MRPPVLALLFALVLSIAWAAPGNRQRQLCPVPAAQSTRTVAVVRQGGDRVLLESAVDGTGVNGRLTLRPLSTGGGGISTGAAPLWEAGAVLAGRPAPRDRNIFTLVRHADGSTASVPFTWDQLGQDERAWLELAPADALPDGLGEARVDFLRGERAREIGRPDGVFRRRAGILGDAVHSTPLLVGAPSPAVQGDGYDAFHSRYKSRPEAIYLGANDGMLHAFDARDGAELFAYVPNALLPFLGQLGDPGYRHRPYVDGSPGQGEALLNGRWRSVLVSGMGMGARGVFALDVSDPGAFADGERALWEFTEHDDAQIGYVSAPPLVARVRVGSKNSAAQYRYFAVVSSGIDNHAREPGNTDGALFLLALDKPATERWQRGVNYYKLAAPAAVAGQANALGPPTLVTTADGTARYAYAGDLQGVLWRFDFSGAAPFSSARLFEARDDSGRRQPIAQAPRAVFAPGGGYLVLFGTGTPIGDDGVPADDFAPQSFYAVKDSALTPVAPVNGRGALARRTLSGDAAFTVAGDDFDYGGEGARQGWYFDFVNAGTDGEHLAASPLLAAGAVFISTIVAGADPCAAPSTRTYVLDALTGFTAPAGAATGRLVKSGPGVLPLLVDLGAVTGARNATGGVAAVRTIAIVGLREQGAPAVEQVQVSLPAGRISWREVPNWQELHEAAKR